MTHHLLPETAVETARRYLAAREEAARLERLDREPYGGIDAALEAAEEAADAWRDSCEFALRLCDQDPDELLAREVVAYDTDLSRWTAFEVVEEAVFAPLGHMDEPCRDAFLVAFAAEHDLDPGRLFIRAYAAISRRQAAAS